MRTHHAICIGTNDFVFGISYEMHQMEGGNFKLEKWKTPA